MIISELIVLGFITLNHFDFCDYFLLLFVFNKQASVPVNRNDNNNIGKSIVCKYNSLERGLGHTNNQSVKIN